MNNSKALTLDLAPPSSIPDEVKTLAAMVIDPEVLTLVLEQLLPHDFYQDKNRLIFTAIQSLSAQNVPLEAQYLRQELLTLPGTAQAGGLDFLVNYFETLLVYSANSDNGIFYAGEVLKHSRLRDVVLACQTTLAEARGQVDDIDGFLAMAETRFRKLASERPSKVSYTAMKKLLSDAIDWAEDRQINKHILSGIDTGLSVINTMTNGLQKGDLILIAARPSIGKTSLMMNIAEHAALKMQTPCGIISMEMNRDQLARRFLSSGSGVPLTRMRSGNTTFEDWDDLAAFASKSYEAPIFIDDVPRSIAEIRRAARAMHSQQNIGMLGVDYIQIAAGTADTRGNKRLETAEVAQGLKDIGQELNIPVVALSQLSRQVENRPDKRPQMNDLMESGNLEAIADVVGLLYRKDFYEKQKVDKTEGAESGIKVFPAELIFGKHRNGETGMVRLGFHAEVSRFVNFEPHLADYMAAQYQDALDAGEEE